MNFDIKYQQKISKCQKTKIIKINYFRSRNYKSRNTSTKKMCRLNFNCNNASQCYNLITCY